MTPFCPGEQNRNKAEILAPILDEFILKLFVYVNCVEGALVVFQADGRGSHGVVVLWADDDDDQVFFFREVPLFESNMASL